MNLDRSLAKLYKVTELMKDELDGKIMTKFAGLRAKLGYLIDDNSEDKKAKGTKMCVVKRKRKFENCKNCLEGTKPGNKIKYLEKKIQIQNVLKKS